MKRGRKIGQAEKGTQLAVSEMEAKQFALWVSKDPKSRHIDIVNKLAAMSNAGDGALGKFLKRVGTIIESGAHRQWPDAKFHYLCLLTGGPGPFNASAVAGDMKLKFNQTVSEKWVRVVLKKQGKAVFRRGRPKTGN